MSNAVSEKAKTGGFNPREVAQLAARRAGVRVGEWLNSVIADRARDLGVAETEFSDNERLDALVARIAGVAESLQPEEDSGQARGMRSRQRVASARSVDSGSMAQVPIANDKLETHANTRTSDRSDSEQERVRGAELPWLEDVEDRGGARRKLEEWEKDLRLDQALELAERRASETDDRAMVERQRQTVAALAQEVDRLNRAERDVVSVRKPPRRPDPAAPVRRGEPRQIRDVVGSVAERIEAIETRIAHRDADLANRPIVAALSRLEDRFEHLLRRNNDGMRETARVEATFRDFDGRLREIAQRLDRSDPGLPTRSLADIERIDGNLSAILSRLDPAAAAGQAATDEAWDTPSIRSPRTTRREAVAEISQRQADLEQFESHRASLLRGTSYPTIDQARRDLPLERDYNEPVPEGHDEPRRRSIAADLEFDSMRGLQDAFSRLTERMESRLDEAARTRAKLEDRTEDISSLKSGIAALGDRLDEMKRQTEDDRLASEENDTIDVLRNEIAALQVGLAKLAPQSAIATLENAVRDLGSQIDDSRRDGVADAVLEPLERLRQEVRQALADGDVRATIGNVEQQLKAVGTRIARIEAQGLDQDSLTALQAQTKDIRDLLHGAATHFQSATRLESEIGQLGKRIEGLSEPPPRSAIRDLELAVNEIRTMLVEFSPESALQDVSRKLDKFAERMNAVEEQVAIPVAMFDEFSRRIDEANASLAERLLKAAPASVDLASVEAMIGGLSGKIDGLRHSSSDMQALGGLVRGLAAQIEEARLPSTDARILDTLETQVGRLAERLDQSDASLDAITSVERLIRDLFAHIDETRTATVDAAELAARNAAQETLRAALVSPAIAGEEASARATRVVEQVGQELSEFRKSQQISEKRIHSTLLALNDTLERMVDRMVSDAEKVPTRASARPLTADVLPAAPRSAERQQADDAPAVEVGIVSPAQDLSRETAAKPIEAKVAAPTVKAAVPPVEIGRSPSEPMPDVSPLIAAARRAAQAAQASAAVASRDADTRTRKETLPGNAEPGAGLRMVFAQRRRPVLLGVAGVVLLLGALQIVRMTEHEGRTTIVESKDAVATPAEPATDGKLAAVVPAPEPAPSSVTDAASTATPAPAVDAAKAPVASVAPPVVTAAATPAPTATGLLSGDATQTPAVVTAPSTNSFEPADPAPRTLSSGLRELADRGNPAAQYEVGARLAEGRTVPRDVKAAVGWFERAGKQGFAPAEYRLGSIYEKGTGVPTDAALALSWYEKAANQGNVRAMHNLAVMAAEGSVAKPDYVRAATWFAKAAEHGVRDSQYNLAILYARGLGLPQDLPQSYTWFSIAAAQGDADAGKKRDDVASKLDAGKIAAAKVASEAFRPLSVDRSANEVSPPPGGWDVAAPLRGTPTPKVSTM